MGQRSKIEWTEATWNPATGCSKLSRGCLNCYAEKFAKRFAGRYGYPKDNPFQVTLHPNRMSKPLKWSKPHKIFVCSMGDLFHENVPENYIFEILNVIKRCPNHIFQILTKREKRMYEISQKIGCWPNNVWLGVTVEGKECVNRIDSLKKINATIKFMSCEPLLENLGKIHLQGINWVIVGGESGYKARTMSPEWAISIRDQCLKENIPYFFKQWGGANKKKAGRCLEGKEWNQMPIPSSNNAIDCQMTLHPQ